MLSFAKTLLRLRGYYFGRICLPAYCFGAKIPACHFIEHRYLKLYYQSFAVQLASFILIIIMPPRRKIESKKVEKNDVKGNGEMMVQNDVKPRGRGKKTDVKPDKIVEEMEEVTKAPKVKKGLKKGLLPAEEPKTRARKAKVESDSAKELAPQPVSKEPSPSGSKRGRKPKSVADDLLIDADVDDEPPTKKVPKKATKVVQKADESAPIKAKRGRKPTKIVENRVDSEEGSEEEKVTEKKKIAKQQAPKVAEKDMDSDDGSEELVVEKKKTVKQQKGDTEKNITETNYENIDFSACEKNSKGEEANMKIASWNIGGIRAWLKKDGLQYIINESPDILCLQETKCSEKKLPEDFVSALTDGTGKYHMYWLDGDKDGYAGVAILTRIKPLSVSYGIGQKEMDKESRSITVHFENYCVINVYVPNAGRGLVTLPKRLEWNKLFRSYVKDLNNDKPVIVCGDMNVAHNEIDLKNPKANKKNAGFTQEERDGMTTFLDDGYVDVYRQLYPNEKDCYTFWSYMSNARSKNVGWRLDYFLVSERFMENICDSKIRSTIYGSDHCPLTLHFNCDN